MSPRNKSLSTRCDYRRCAGRARGILQPFPEAFRGAFLPAIWREETLALDRMRFRSKRSEPVPLTSPDLSHALYRQVPPEFFRILASGRTGRLYVDALERAAVQRVHGIEREDALALIEDAVESHADVRSTKPNRLARR